MTRPGRTWAPVTAKDVTPGSHKLNASAEGYDGYSDTIEVAAGTAEIAIRFKEIRLNESVEVVHKHGMGSCEGRLQADAQGMRYETSNKDDAFSLKYGDIETFEVDYLKKNLRIKQRGSKTWNFTTKAENADPYRGALGGGIGGDVWERIRRFPVAS